MNTQAQAADSRGRIHAVMWHATYASLRAARGKSEGSIGPPDARYYHHYYRETDGIWHHVELPGVASGRPKLFFDRHDNAFLILNTWHADYPGPDGQGVIQARSDLQIMVATARAKWADWRVLHTESGPFGDEMLGDPHRWQAEGVLSIIAQESPLKPRDPTPLRILDFKFEPR